MAHIKSASTTYTNLGIEADRFIFDPVQKIVRISLAIKDFHVGHSADGIGIVHGGILAFLVDAASVALAFTQCKPGYVPVHCETNIENAILSISNAKPLEVLSTFRNNSVPDRKISVRTVVMQGTHFGVAADSSLKLLPERFIKHVAAQARSRLSQV